MIPPPSVVRENKSSLYSRYRKVNYGVWHFHNPLFASSLANFRLAEKNENEKKLERCPGERSDILQFGKWRESFSSDLCFVL